MPRPPRASSPSKTVIVRLFEQTLKGSELDEPVTAEFTENLKLPASGQSQVPFLSLWNLIIRPRRCVYLTLELGPQRFSAGGKACVRHDTQIRTSRGFALECSYFRPQSDDAARNSPVLVYLHGNSGSRMESVDLAVPLLQCGISLFSYDAAGCGLSEGDYVSLGYHESEDLCEVLDFLKRGSPSLGPPCGRIALWGRSMGAVTALLYAAKDKTEPGITAMCLDSPFTSLRQLASELAQSEPFKKAAGFSLPNWMFEAAFAVVRLRVQALADFDMEDVAPLSHAPQTTVPAFFIHGSSDHFITSSHSQQIFEAYGAEKKKWKEVEGTHNSVRDVGTQEEMFAWLVHALLKPGRDPGPRPRHIRGGATSSASTAISASRGKGKDWPLPPPSMVEGPAQIMKDSPAWEPVFPEDDDEDEDALKLKVNAVPANLTATGAGHTGLMQQVPNSGIRPCVADDDVCIPQDEMASLRNMAPPFQTRTHDMAPAAPWDAAVPREGTVPLPKADKAIRAAPSKSSDQAVVQAKPAPSASSRGCSRSSCSSEAMDLTAEADDDIAVPQLPRRHPVLITTDFVSRSSSQRPCSNIDSRATDENQTQSGYASGVISSAATRGDFGPQPIRQVRPSQDLKLKPAKRTPSWDEPHWLPIEDERCMV